MVVSSSQSFNKPLVPVCNTHRNSRRNVFEIDVNPTCEEPMSTCLITDSLNVNENLN